jgi:VanZ family protein
MNLVQSPPHLLKPNDGKSEVCPMIVLSRLAGLLTVVAIGVLSLVPGRARPDIVWPFSLEHALAYLAAAILLCVGFRRPRANVGTFDVRLLIIICALSVYGGLLELLQHFVPGRSPSLMDWSANAIGALLGAALTWLLPRFVPDAIRR